MKHICRQLEQVYQVALNSLNIFLRTTQTFLYTVAPRYNAVVGVHEMEPRCKRGAL